MIECPHRAGGAVCDECEAEGAFNDLTQQLAAVTTQLAEAKAREAALHTVLTLTGLAVPDLSDGAAKLLGDLEAVTAERDSLGRRFETAVGQIEALQLSLEFADKGPAKLRLERDQALAQVAALRDLVRRCRPLVDSDDFAFESPIANEIDEALANPSPVAEVFIKAQAVAVATDAYWRAQHSAYPDHETATKALDALMEKQAQAMHEWRKAGAP